MRGLIVFSDYLFQLRLKFNLLNYWDLFVWYNLIKKYVDVYMMDKYDNMQDFPESPFEPGHSIYPDNFKGRKKDIIKISRQLPKVKNKGIPAHFFITGKRGIGKTSFVKYFANEICDKYDLTPIYVNNDGIRSLDEFIVRLIEALLKQCHEKILVNNYLNLFQNMLKDLMLIELV